MSLTIKEDFNYDEELLVEDSLDSSGDASAITASQAGKVLDEAKVLDVGDGVFEGYLVADVSAIEVGTDEEYRIKIQGTNTAAFGGTDIVDLAQIHLGHADNLVGATASTTGRHVIPFRNVLNGQVYRYLRAYTYMADGTAESIKWTGWIAPLK